MPRGRALATAAAVKVIVYMKQIEWEHRDEWCSKPPASAVCFLFTDFDSLSKALTTQENCLEK